MTARSLIHRSFTITTPRVAGLSRWLPCLVGVAWLASGCEANQTHPANTTPYEAGSMAPLACVPNLDGVIDSSELQPVLGTAAAYTVNPPGTSRTVDVAGATDSSGHLVWDWATSYSGDEVASISATPLTGKWYAAAFPGGQFAAPFDAGGTLQAVYSQDGNGLYLHGLASTEENPAQGKTLYVYDQPITLYVFPLKPGTTWTSTGSVKNATLRGLTPYAGTDTYQGTDDATGQLLLPDFTFTQAHRLRFVVTATSAAGGAPVVSRQVSFLFECFGEVARATSQPGEANQNFTTAVEERRLGM